MRFHRSSANRVRKTRATLKRGSPSMTRLRWSLPMTTSRRFARHGNSPKNWAFSTTIRIRRRSSGRRPCAASERALIAAIGSDAEEQTPRCERRDGRVSACVGGVRYRGALLQSSWSLARPRKDWGIPHQPFRLTATRALSRPRCGGDRDFVRVGHAPRVCRALSPGVAPTHLRTYNAIHELVLGDRLGADRGAL